MENNSTGITTIGQARIKTYETLSRYPLYDYFCDTGKGKECNVLLIGNGWVGTEFFKAIFWCGVYPGVKLNITIASDNADVYKKKLNECLPGLKDFADFDDKKESKYHYANIQIRKVLFANIEGDGIDAKIAGKECLNLQAQNYIVVAVGNSDTSYLIADGIESIIKSNTKIPHIVLTFTDEKFSEDSLCKAVECSVHNEVLDKLYSLAKNINFMYAMKNAGNSDVDINKVNESFYEKSYKSEFESSIKPSDQFESIGNFLGGSYDADSSLAAAVSIQYKLHYCNDEKGNPYDCAELIKSINERNDTFSELVQWEHDRWNAFMTIRGFRYPTDPEKREDLFNGENDHRKRKDAPYLHMCLCSSAGRDIRQGIDWEQPKSELDQTSVDCRKCWGQLAKRRRKEIKESITAFQSDLEAIRSRPLKQALNNFIDSVEQLFENKDNAFKNYKIDYDALKGLLEKESKAKSKVLESIDKALDAQVRFNQKTDFFSYDEDLVEMIPYCIRMDENWTFVTAVEDPTVADALVPWLTFAKKAVFIYPKEYRFALPKEKFKTFFESNGHYTECEWVESSFEFNSLFNKITKHLGEYSIVGISSNALPQTTLVASRLWDKGIPLVYYDPKNGICSYNTGECQHQLNGKQITINQYLGLKNASITATSRIIPDTDCSRIEELFWKCNVLKLEPREKDKNFHYNPWTRFLPDIFKDKKEALEDSYGKTLKDYFYQNEFRVCADTDNTELLELSLERDIRDIAIPIRLHDFLKTARYQNGTLIFKREK